MLRSPSKNGVRFCVGLFALMAIGMLIAAASAIFVQPRTYRALADHGVLVQATVQCGRNDCALTYTYAGREHTNRSDDLDQFCCTAQTPALVDPDDPATMYTVYDVQHGTNGGVGVFSVAMLLLGLFFGALTAAMFVGLRTLPDPLPPEPPPGPDASTVARALYAIDQVQDLLDHQAYRLSQSAWYRVDPDELAARVEEMRRRVFELQGPRSQALEAADRVAGEVRAARRIPVIGGACVRAFELSEQIDQVRLGAIEAVRSGI